MPARNGRRGPHHANDGAAAAAATNELSGHNSLWIQWLEDWKSHVSERYAQSLARAQSTLRTHPHPILDPDELLPLKFFGPAIVKRIKDRCRAEHLRTRDLNAYTITTDTITQPRQQYVTTQHQHQPNEPSRFAALSTPSTEGLRFAYCDEHQTPVPSQTQSAVLILEVEHILGYHILFEASGLEIARSSDVRHIRSAYIDQNSDQPRLYHGILPETSGLILQQPTILDPFAAVAAPSSSAQATIISRPRATLASHATDIRITSNVPRGHQDHSLGFNRWDSPLITEASSAASPALSFSASRPASVIPPHPTAVTLARSSSTSSQLAGSSGSSAFHLSGSLDTALIDPASVSLTRWPANTYDILCVVDNREIKDKSARDSIIQELQSRGVSVERRSLELGDVLWIARRKQLGFGGAAGSTVTTGDVVLDFVIERKKLSDLVASIKDGRFHEQKFRLRKSGISNVFFLLEASSRDYHDAEAQSFEDAINTAVTSTQIVDEFFMHQTSDTKGTIELLKILHDSICDKHRNTDLYLIPPQYIRRESYESLKNRLRVLHPGQTILTTYESFTLLNAKSTFLTAKECFAKQLLCIRGMSPEKASVVVDTYGTLRHLWEAFRQAELETRMSIHGTWPSMAEDTPNSVNITQQRKKTSQRPELLLADLGKGRRRIGDSLSRKVYHLFMDDVYKDEHGPLDVDDY
ncbi:hypothetical protein CPB86DRAFT_785467, partial [Serendipita vermifera]